MKDTISKEDFMRLRCGDKIKWHRKGGWYYRTVLQGPADVEGSNMIVLPIRHRSWTGRVTTTVDYQSCRNRAEITSKRASMVVSKDEIFRWLASGFNPSKGLKRELVDELNWAKRQPSRFTHFDCGFVKKVLGFIRDLQFAEL